MLFFNWLLAPSKRIDRLHQFRLHLLIFTTLLTGILMWSYAYTAYNYINHESIRLVGIIYATIHLLNIPLYKYTGSIEKSLYVMLIPGGMFQVHFSILSGGFLNPILMWIAILPVIAGVLTGLRHTLVWISIIVITSLTIFFLDFSYGFFQTDYLDHEGLIVTQSLAVFGMIFLHSGLTIMLLKVRDVSVKQLKDKALSKENLLRVLAHDVSTPLTLIQNNTQFLKRVLKNESLDSTQLTKLREKVLSTNKYSHKIFNVINAVREMEAFESGKKSIEFDSINLKECINETLTLLESSINKKKVVVRTIIDNESVLGLKNILEHQVLTNIIYNSIKFSKEGSEIKIYTKCNESTVEIFIADYGIGMPKAILKNIFNPLIHTSRPGTHGEAGTGFGLPIAKRCTEFMGGDIEASSNSIKDHPNNHGTTFKLTFKKAINNS